MTPDESPDALAVVYEELVKAMSDPLRIQVFTAVSQRPGITVAAIARRLGESPRRVRHQVDRLLDGGLIEVDGQTPKRNTREIHYRATAPAIIDDSSLPADDNRRIALALLKMVVMDIARSAAAGTVTSRDGWAVVRMGGAIDEQGWDELAETMVRAMAEVEGTMQRSAERLEASGERGIEAFTSLLFFEAPEWEEGSSQSRDEAR